jgi:tRNA nucleotidyltransferase (CCA-adding enzyme)
MAVPVSQPGGLIDHHGGRDDLAAGLVRVLHGRSFIDDPTRALRAARYAARLDLEIEPQTLTLLLDSDFSTVSADRIDGELERLAAEPHPERALALLAEWGLVAIEPAEIRAFGAAARLAGEARWRGSADLGRLLVEMVRGDLYARSSDLGAAEPATASAAVDLAANRGGEEILLARALGGEWLDRYVDEWRGVKLEISGDDLLAAGIPQGPAIGHGLEASLRAKLDAGVASREDELRIALEAART